MYGQKFKELEKAYKTQVHSHTHSVVCSATVSVCVCVCVCVYVCVCVSTAKGVEVSQGSRTVQEESGGCLMSF